jgi:hypothetical protein
LAEINSQLVQLKIVVDFKFSWLLFATRRRGTMTKRIVPQIGFSKVVNSWPEPQGLSVLSTSAFPSLVEEYRAPLALAVT